MEPDRLRRLWQRDGFNPRVSHRSAPELRKISLLKRAASGRRKDERGPAFHSIQHPAQRLRARNLDLITQFVPTARFSRTNTNFVAVIGRPREP